MDKLDYPRPRPPIGIIPLGTGNDLSRSLGWGGKYRDKPLRKVLSDISRADIVDMDRWSLSLKTDQLQQQQLQVDRGVTKHCNKQFYIAFKN